VPILDDADPDILISRLAGPLPLDARAAFRQAAEAALARVPCWGEGAIYRAVAVLQRDYFVRPTIIAPPGTSTLMSSLLNRRATSALFASSSRSAGCARMPPIRVQIV
jgi:hypothetical protein